ncbi:glycoside hydrolase/deacetylase [Coprinopsis sp. MPI-PUGE-AT-0042]|nr:glycoside hydrolase/deacetylase [Coprinopsis sp. MPI-PUGE-AT-0042]
MHPKAALFQVLAVASSFLLTLALPPVPPVPRNYAGARRRAEVVYSCTVPNTAALTFDDGPWIYHNDIVDTLDAAGVKGTFFFNGDNYGCIYDTDIRARVKYAYDHGHLVGSHTWHHYDLSTLSWDQIHDEMWRVELALTRILGVIPAFMRPPFGSFNDLVAEASGVRGQTIAIWDLDSEDADGATVETSKGFYNTTIASHPQTILALNHETVTTTAYEVLPFAIAELKKAGYNMVTLAECLGVPAYQSVTTPGTPDASWTC